MNTMNIIAFALPGPQELMVIAAILVLLFGAKMIPRLTRGIGDSVKEVFRAKREIEREIRDVSDLANTSLDAEDREREKERLKAEAQRELEIERRAIERAKEELRAEAEASAKQPAKEPV